jgi:hypothetical protein
MVLLELLFGLGEWLEWTWSFWRWVLSPRYRLQVRGTWRTAGWGYRLWMVFAGLITTVIGILPFVALGLLLATS